MSRIVSSALTTRAHSRQRSSQPSFVQTSLAVAMFSALTSISFAASALTMDQANKTVTVDEDYTPTVVQDQGSLSSVTNHARLFSNVVLAESEGSSSGASAASQPEASGFTLNLQESVICPAGTSEMACPVGAARIEHNGSPVATTNNNTVTVSGNAELRSEVATHGASLYAGFIDIGDQTNASSVTGTLLADHNRIVIDNLSSQNMEHLVAGYVHANDIGKPGIPSGTVEAKATNNEVVINGGTVNLKHGFIAGGFASVGAKNAVNVSAIAENNTVTINNITEDADKDPVSGLYGAHIAGGSDTGDVSYTGRNNQVVIKGGTFGRFGNGIVGAQFSSDDRLMTVTAENNSVQIDGGSFTDVSNVYGTYIYHALNRTQLVGNQVTVTGGDFTSGRGTVFTGSYVQPYLPTLDITSGPIVATDNKVTVAGGRGKSTSLYGTRVSVKVPTHTLTGNTATLSGGTWSFISQVVGASSVNAMNSVTANNNKVELSGGSVTSPIFGAYAAHISGLQTPTTETQDVVAQNNEVVLKGNVPVSTVAGAYATGADLSKTKLTLTNNKVTISDEAKLDGANVYGALVPTTKLATVLSADIFSGNTLVVDNYTGTSKLAKIANFEKFKFVLPESYEVNKSVALQTVNLSLVSPTNSKQQARVESVSLLGEPRVLKAGDHVNLINADNPITGELANKDQRLVVNQGVTVSTSTLVRQEGNQIYLEVENTPTNGGLGGSRPTTPTTQPETEDTSNTAETPDTGVTSDTPASDNTVATTDNTTPTTEVASNEPVSQVKPVAKTFSEGYLAGALASVRAGDLVAGQAMTEAKLVKERFARWKGFGVASGIHGKYRTGSHIDTKDTSLVAGLLRGVQFDTANLTLGVFFEAGRSRYDTHNDVSEGGHGRGTVDYTGGGALVRLDAHNGLYAEASVRAGNARNEFDSSLVDALGRTSSYKVHSNYFGFHVGAGYEWQLNDKLGGEVYTKYLFTRLDGNDVTTTTGDLLSFDSVTSQRLRVGGRVAYQMTERLSPYVGLGVEREFSAKSKATTFGLPISAPSLTGTSGMAEVGLKLLEPKGQYGWSADVNLRGYFGTRQEIGGNVRVGYKF